MHFWVSFIYLLRLLIIFYKDFSLINAYQEFQVSREETIAKLEDNFDLSRECAEDYVQRYWK